MPTAATPGCSHASLASTCSCSTTGGLAPLRDQDRRDLLEIFEDRYGARSTILTSQLPVERWHDHLGEATVADAICDRLLHNAHRIALTGPSRRKEDAQLDA